jgi:Icc protein
MTTIAHITDLHIVEPDYQERPWGERARLHYLSFGRPIEPEERKKRVARALEEVHAAGVDHLLITGDLTEDGKPEQFEVLAELLAESRIASDRITLVPGNHDAYEDGGAYAEAMAGPLKAYAPTSEIGSCLALRDATIVPVSTSFHQSCLRSAGAIAKAEMERLVEIAVDPTLRGKPLIFAQHHQPGRHYLPILQWIDGFTDHRDLSALFERCPHLYVVHGHTHRATNRSVGRDQTPRIFSAKAVVESQMTLRLYDASPGGLSPLASDLPEAIGALALPA